MDVVGKPGPEVEPVAASNSFSKVAESRPRAWLDGGANAVDDPGEWYDPLFPQPSHQSTEACIVFLVRRRQPAGGYDAVHEAAKRDRLLPAQDVSGHDRECQIVATKAAIVDRFAVLASEAEFVLFLNATDYRI